MSHAMTNSAWYVTCDDKFGIACHVPCQIRRRILTRVFLVRLCCFRISFFVYVAIQVGDRYGARGDLVGIVDEVMHGWGGVVDGRKTCPG